MKKISISVCILLATLCFSQSITKKYNSYYERYEYYEPSGNMISYEKYNYSTKQWEMYNADGSAVSNTARKPTQYRDPKELNISNLGNATSTLQNRYNNNVQQVQNTVNTISNQINSLDVTSEQRKLISDTFQKSCVNELNKTRINYASANETNRIIKWLYDSVNTIITNVTGN